jgi:hypothetical protein
VQQRRRERAERDRAEQQEGDGRADKVVKRVSGVDIGIGDGRTGGRQDAWNMRGGKTGHAGMDLGAPRPFAGGNE